MLGKRMKIYLVNPNGKVDTSSKEVTRLELIQEHYNFGNWEKGRQEDMKTRFYLHYNNK